MKDQIYIRAPLRGGWRVFNPPGHPRLAFDFLAEGENRSFYKNANFLKHCASVLTVENTFAWGAEVYSPVAGEIVGCENGVPDRLRISFLYDLFSLLLHKPRESAGFKAFGGNYVCIKSGDFFVLLCHLRQGSVQVEVGEHVTEGQLIGQIGNSGSSIQPHLHLQVMDSLQYLPLFKNLLPYGFERAQIFEGKNYVQHKFVSLENKTHYIFE